MPAISQDKECSSFRIARRGSCPVSTAVVVSFASLWDAIAMGWRVKPTAD